MKINEVIEIHKKAYSNLNKATGYDSCGLQIGVQYDSGTTNDLAMEYVLQTEKEFIETYKYEILSLAARKFHSDLMSAGVSKEDIDEIFKKTKDDNDIGG